MKVFTLVLMMAAFASCAHKLNPQYGQQSPNPDFAHRISGFDGSSSR